MSRSNSCSWRDERRRRRKAKRRLHRCRYKGRRTDLPRRILRALDISDFDGDFTEQWLLTMAQQQHFWPLVEQATRVEQLDGEPGRPPLSGSWALLLASFVRAKDVSLTKFLVTRTTEFWEQTEFTTPVSKGAFWDNLERMERDCLGVFADAAWFVLRRLDRYLDGDVLRDWWFDCTICLSPSRWYHCCEDAECPRRRIAAQRKKHVESPHPSRHHPTPEQIRRARDLPDDPDADDGELTSNARSHQSPDRSTSGEDDDPKPKSGGVPRLPSRRSIIARLYGAQEADQDAAGLEGEGFRRPTRSPLLLARDALDAHRAAMGVRRSHETVDGYYGGLIDDYEGPGRFFTLKATGCLYFTADADAAVRRKSDHNSDDVREDKRRYEKGDDSPVLAYDVARLVSWGAGAVLGILVRSEHETRLYRPTLEAALQRARYKPRAVVLDAIGGLRPVSDVSAEHGIGHVCPSFGYGREKNDQWVDDPHGRWDRYGIPRCKHCGAPCRYVKARHHQGSNGERRWRLLFQCALPQKSVCKKTQSLYVDEDTRILTTIWRDRAVWHALTGSRGSNERSHHLDRKRFFVTTDQHLVRSGRKGVRFQQLCGEIAMLITALKFAWLQGVIDSLRRVPKAVTVSTGEKGLARFWREYRKAHLNECRPDFVEARRAYEASRARRSPTNPNQLE